MKTCKFPELHRYHKDNHDIDYWSKDNLLKSSMVDVYETLYEYEKMNAYQLSNAVHMTFGRTEQVVNELLSKGCVKWAKEGTKFGWEDPGDLVVTEILPEPYDWFKVN